MKCRCNYEGSNDTHPCHANDYSCKKPARLRFYNPQAVALSGMQLKFQVTDTWACDECWKKFIS